MNSIETLRTLVGFDTTSRLSNLALIEWTANYLETQRARLRFTYNDEKPKTNLLASFGPNREGG